jgi:hypothetical protein
LLDALAGARELGPETRGTFREIKQLYQDVAGVRARVTHLVEIEARDGDIQEEDSGGQRRYRVPLSYFSDSNRTQPSRLVAEDRDDARVYTAAARGYAFRYAKRLAVHLQDYGGGGANTGDAVRDHARHGPTLCVVDADHKWSDDIARPAEGQTAAKAREAARALAGEAVCCVHAVPCREIENLLPRDLVLSCFVETDAGEFHRRCVRAAELGLLAGGPRVDRLDLKKGLRRQDFEHLPEDHPERRYLARAFDERHTDAPAPPGGWCADATRCAAGSPCTCVLFEGIGEGLLARVADTLDKLSPQKVAERLLAAGQPHEEAWTAIGRLLFSWGCGYSRSRT